MFQVLECPTFFPTHEEFGEPFCEYVGRIFENNKDLPMLKVVPPKGWKPREAPLPSKEKLQIQQPVKQQVFGERGVYRCLLLEQKNLNGESFKEIADNQEKYKPKKQFEGDPYLERAFWSQITLNSPLYGADTPQSMFDEKLAYGWNLRNLGDLLQQSDLPQVPGVTSPMTYFGMWKAMFCWHTEDYDLLSINYLHTGAPKIWYCISPKHRKKFEEVAATEFFEAHRSCSSFLRHKDILFSPTFLKSHNIPYTTAVQHQNEFIVLNVGAYHAGYNAGFNIAEAVNFALPAWVKAGKQCKLCNCRKDAVQIDMSMFDDISTSSNNSSGGIYRPYSNNGQEVESNKSKTHKLYKSNKQFQTQQIQQAQQQLQNISQHQQSIQRPKGRQKGLSISPGTKVTKLESKIKNSNDQQLNIISQTNSKSVKTGLKLKLRTTNLHKQMQNIQQTSDQNLNIQNQNSPSHKPATQDIQQPVEVDLTLEENHIQPDSYLNSFTAYNHIGQYKQQQVQKPQQNKANYHVVTRSRTQSAVQGNKIQKRIKLITKNNQKQGQKQHF